MHQFVGKWRIRKMGTWPQDYVDLLEPGTFEFAENGQGWFVFGTVKGWLDVRVSSEPPLLEFSWHGRSDTDEACGRGWFRFPESNTGEGMIYIHCADESSITIERET